MAVINLELNVPILCAGAGDEAALANGTFQGFLLPPGARTLLYHLSAAAVYSANGDQDGVSVGADPARGLPMAASATLESIRVVGQGDYGVNPADGARYANFAGNGAAADLYICATDAG